MPDPSRRRITAGVLAILLGGFGIHKFYLGYTTAGLIMLLTTLFTCGAGITLMWTIGIIEGILYLTKTDAEFAAAYGPNGRKWF